MTNEEINTAIAEACGWTLTARNWWYKDGEYFALPPDYCTNLNAMHEAEKLLEGSARLDDLAYRLHMQDICGTLTKSIRSTARQRAEAFLKTLNLWEQ